MIKKENGITMLMLIISVIIMLIIATILINATVGDNGLLNNSSNSKFKADAIAIKERFQEKVAVRSDIEQKSQAELSGLSSDLNDILNEKEYKKYKGKFDINTANKLVYLNSANFTEKQKEILKELDIPSKD